MIEIEDFARRYGSFVAVDGLTMTVPAGHICGFVGPNGAGKSTTIRFLATLLRPDRGDARVDGRSVTREPDAVRRVVGYMPEEFGVYDGMRVWEYVDFFGAAYGVPAATRRATVAEALELVDLAHKRDTPVQGLSRGMKQRLCLAKSLVHDPKALILDEPASGLDPRARIEIKALLRELRSMGKTILISSHILSELADLCDEIAIMERGKLLAFGPLKEIAKKLRAHRTIEISVLGGESPRLTDLLGRRPDVVDVQTIEGFHAVNFVGDDAALASLVRDAVLAGVEIVSVRERETNLEEMFMTITTGAVN